MDRHRQETDEPSDLPRLSTSATVHCLAGCGLGEAVDLGLMLRRAGGVLGIGIGYLLIVSVVGYMIALVIVLAAMLIYFGERASGRIALAATVGAGLFWVLFDRLLGIPMPGIWGL